MKRKYLLKFHEIMDVDFTAITLHSDYGMNWSNTDETQLYTNQEKEIEMDDIELEFLVHTLDLNVI